MVAVNPRPPPFACAAALKRECRLVEIPALKLGHGLVSVKRRQMLLGDGFPGGIERWGD